MSSGGAQCAGCLPVNSRGRSRSRHRRRQARTSKQPEESAAEQSKNRRKRRNSSNRHDEWLQQSPVVRMVQGMLQQGIVSSEEANTLVAGDRLWRQHAVSSRERVLPPRPKKRVKDEKGLHDTSRDSEDFDAQCIITDADLGLGQDPEPLDPISLEPLDTVHFFCFRGQQCYNVASLVTYLLSSHDFRDPITRLEFTAAEVNIIERKRRRCPACSEMDDVFKSWEKWDAKAKEAAADHENAITGVEHLLDGAVASIRDIITGEPCHGLQHDRFARSSWLLTRVFPELDDLCRQLHSIAPDRVLACLKLFAVQLHGHPKRPNKDPFELRNFCLSHFNELGARYS